MGDLGRVRLDCPQGGGGFGGYVKAIGYRGAQPSLWARCGDSSRALVENVLVRSRQDSEVVSHRISPINSTCFIFAGNSDQALWRRATGVLGTPRIRELTFMRGERASLALATCTSKGCRLWNGSRRMVGTAGFQGWARNEAARRDADVACSLGDILLLHVSHAISAISFRVLVTCENNRDK